MRTLGNILWHFPFLGFITAEITFIIGTLLVITVVGAPIGLGLIEFSKFLLSPFSKAMVNKKDLDIKQNEKWEKFGFVVRVVYFPFGLFFVIAGALQAIFLALTIVGIPVAIIIAKSLPTYFNPINKKCVARVVADELEKKKAKQELDSYTSNNENT